MIADFADFCLHMYVLIDDAWKTVTARVRRPGPPPTTCSDSELLTMVLVGECRGWDQETVLHAQWREHRDLFPRLPSRDRFNRRRRALWPMLNLLRQALLRQVDLAQDRQCLLDSLPIPVLAYHSVPGAANDWAQHGAAFGTVASKKQVIYGYKLQLLITLNGLILDFVLAPANVADVEAGAGVLDQQTALDVVADKGYVSAALYERLAAHRDIQLLTDTRSNQKRQQHPALVALINRVRQLIETVNGQLVEQFRIQTNHAHTFWGLCARLMSKLTAHTCCLYLNRMLGQRDLLHIKRLAFPN